MCLVSVVCCQVEVSAAGRGILPTVVRLIVIATRGGRGHIKGRSARADKIIVQFAKATYLRLDSNRIFLLFTRNVIISRSRWHRESCLIGFQARGLLSALFLTHFRQLGPGTLTTWRPLKASTCRWKKRRLQKSFMSCVQPKSIFCEYEEQCGLCRNPYKE